MKRLLIFLLLAMPVAAQTIADYPYFLFTDRTFNAYIIKGDLRTEQEISASNLVINSLPKLYRPMFRVYNGFDFYSIRADERTVVENVRLASQVQYLDKPAVIIGTPCTNEWARRVLRLEECNAIPADKGLVIVGGHNGQLVVLITGGSPEAVFAAAKWLHSPDHFRFFSRVARVGMRTGLSSMRIGNGDLLEIGEPIGQVTPAITVGSYPVRDTRSNTYLRFPGGRVVFGKGR
jgi:hypothetical protein